MAPDDAAGRWTGMGLDRFLTAQADHYDEALAELTAGTKQSHWMWFVFPQIAGLGHSATSRHFAIRDLGEARDYLSHPLLGARYLTCVEAVLAHRDRPAEAIMGGVDALKLRSSLTLFDRAGAGSPVRTALTAFFDTPDPATLRLIGAG